MNIEEAKKLIDKQSIGKGGVGDIPVVKTHIVKVLLDQLDQPQPEVPQMIFDVIKSFDDDVDYLHQHMSRQSDEVREWLTHNEREFYEAWLAYPNITIEKEKLYTVEIPNPNERQLSFVLMRQLSENVSIKVMHRDNLDLLKTDNDLQLTESEIRKDFDWAWQFREEVVE
ncbi:TPA: DUF1642 domain-containing protein [Streptococcus agalactiae]|nr:DUF1642 domain-containing protein [Streptococcus agalactiae]HEO6868018.1 DUF1642 domain-containing protein [Streptococcus agalactiae]HEO6955967.1 DUF1642 domain-containing protein [Streptococcus agalactiae]HEO7008299.1 DUF1642 domain-containing protein [Streptococcus agalactiae]HEO7018756.1 DUF1642 domain-containing protein [Streptococcus agalactiae]